MAAATDTEILDFARARGKVVVTIASDFHAILMIRRASGPSVIPIRQQGLNGQAVAAVLTPILQRYSAGLSAGCLVTIKQNKTTCHLLSFPK